MTPEELAGMAKEFEKFFETTRIGTTSIKESGKAMDEYAKKIKDVMDRTGISTAETADSLRGTSLEFYTLQKVVAQLGGSTRLTNREKVANIAADLLYIDHARKALAFTVEKNKAAAKEKDITTELRQTYEDNTKAAEETNAGLAMYERTLKENLKTLQLARLTKPLDLGPQVKMFAGMGISVADILIKIISKAVTSVGKSAQDMAPIMERAGGVLTKDMGVMASRMADLDKRIVISGVSLEDYHKMFQSLTNAYVGGASDVRALVKGNVTLDQAQSFILEKTAGVTANLMFMGRGLGYSDDQMTELIDTMHSQLLVGIDLVNTRFEEYRKTASTTGMTLTDLISILGNVGKQVKYFGTTGVALQNELLALSDPLQNVLIKTFGQAKTGTKELGRSITEVVKAAEEAGMQLDVFALHAFQRMLSPDAAAAKPFFTGLYNTMGFGGIKRTLTEFQFFQKQMGSTLSNWGTPEDQAAALAQILHPQFAPEFTALYQAFSQLGPERTAELMEGSSEAMLASLQRGNLITSDQAKELGKLLSLTTKDPLEVIQGILEKILRILMNVEPLAQLVTRTVTGASRAGTTLGRGAGVAE